jgi:hypothetical protein
MAYTSFGFVIRMTLLYLTFLIVVSIYQAVFPTSPHNKGEIIDHGAEFLQDSFHDLRVYYPRFDYLVQTVYRVVLQVLLWVAMRYNVNTAVYTGIGIGVGLVTVVFVAGWLVFWGVRVVGGLVYGLVFVVVWMPMSLVVGLVQWVGDTIEFVSGFIEFVSSYVDMIWGFVESLLGNDPWTHGGSGGHHTPGDDDSDLQGQVNEPDTDEKEHALEPDHKGSLEEQQRVPELKEPTPTKHAPTDLAATEAAEINSDEYSRHRMEKAQKDLQGSHDTTDSDERRESDGIEIVTSIAAKEILREDFRSDVPARLPTSDPARESPWLFPRSSTHTPIPPMPSIPPMKPTKPIRPIKPIKPIKPMEAIEPMKSMPPMPSPETRRPSRSDEQIPRRTFSWTTDPSEPEANGVWLTFSYNGERIEVSRDGKAYNLSEPVVLSVNGKPVELESDGETIKLPDGRPLKFSIN